MEVYVVLARKDYSCGGSTEEYVERFEWELDKVFLNEDKAREYIDKEYVEKDLEFQLVSKEVE